MQEQEQAPEPNQLILDEEKIYNRLETGLFSKLINFISGKDKEEPKQTKDVVPTTVNPTIIASNDEITKQYLAEKDKEIERLKLEVKESKQIKTELNQLKEQALMQEKAKKEREQAELSKKMHELGIISSIDKPNDLDKAKLKLITVEGGLDIINNLIVEREAELAKQQPISKNTKSNEAAKPTDIEFAKELIKTKNPYQTKYIN